MDRGCKDIQVFAIVREMILTLAPLQQWPKPKLPLSIRSLRLHDLRDSSALLYLGCRCFGGCVPHGT